MEEREKFDKSKFVQKFDTKLLDSYDVNYEIGSGGFSKVYEVRNKASDTIRACKYIDKRNYKEEDVEKFKKEISILKDFDHPNIVKLYEIFETDKSFYLIMEKCNGGNLGYKITERINLEKLFDEKILSEVFRQITSAIKFCHDKGICHRDLKPENICFLNLGSMENNPSKLIDFGFGRVIDPQNKMKSRVGSSLYMAPEVIKKNYNEKCDIWSLGVILFFILSGKPPFFGENDTETTKKILSIKYNFDDDVWKNVSEDAKDLIRHMLVKENERYTAEQVLAHPWIKKYEKKMPNDTKFSIQQLRIYQKMNDFEKKILTFIANRLPENDIRDLTRFFIAFDKNNDGRISFEEFYNGISEISSTNIGKDEAKKIFDTIDTNEDGKIEYTEFISSCINENIYLKKENLLQVFDALDKDKLGKISMDDIKRVVGLDPCCPYIMKIFNKLDKDKDEKINFEEFIKMISIVISETLNKYN